MKKLDLSKNHFMANGKKYFFSSSLSLDRWAQYEKLQPKIGFGKSFESIFTTLETAVNLANTSKGIQAWNCILNLKDSIAERLEDRIESSFEMACLFINREGEDADKIDLQIFEEKINDWKTEGIDAVDFFQLSANLVRGFVDALHKSSRSSLKGLKKELKITKDLKQSK